MLQFTRLEVKSKPRPLSGQRKACMLFTSSAENLLLIFSYHSLLCKVPTTGPRRGAVKDRKQCNEMQKDKQSLLLRADNDADAMKLVSSTIRRGKPSGNTLKFTLPIG